MSILKELEDWVNSSKSHSVEISIDDGYGANFWRVKLDKSIHHVCVMQCSETDPQLGIKWRTEHGCTQSISCSEHENILEVLIKRALELIKEVKNK